MKKLLVIILTLVVGAVHATDENVITSKKYVDDEMAKLQPQFDGLGNDKLMLYSSTTDGEVTSRDIVTSLGTSTTANTVPTRGAIVAGLNTKQDTLNGPAGWVVENTGIAGSVKAKPIYSTTDNYKTALVTAEDLNQIVIDAVNSELTTLPGIGWRINTSVTLPTLRDLYLPEGYTQLEYIESTGTQWINTGLDGNMSYTYELNFQQTDTGLYRNWGVFGQSGFVGQNMSLTYANTGSFYVRWDSTEGQAYLSLSKINTSRHTLKINNGVAYFDGVRKGKTSGHQDGFSINYPVFLGTVNPAGTEPTKNSKAKYYFYSVKDNNGNMLQNFIPARRDSDGEIGMYDLVTGAFFTNSGTGNFIAGPAVSSNLYLPSGD